jgi:hypothetical protein
MEDPILAHLPAQWYPSDAVPLYTFGQDLMLSATIMINGNNVPCSLQDSSTDLALHTKNASIDLQTPSCIFSLSIAGAKNFTSAETAICAQNYLPRAMEMRQDEYDRVQSIFMNQPKGVIEIVPPNFNANYPVPVFVSRQEDHSAFVNPHFIRTVALLNPTNIMNGILIIPRELCMADDRFVVWKPHAIDEEPPADAVHHWYLIPPRHILAMHLGHFENWAKNKVGDPHPVVWRKQEDNSILCFALSDVELEARKRQVLQRWCNLISPRPLSHLSFSATATPLASIALKIRVGYTTWPHMPSQAVINNAIPEFPSELEQLFQI